MRRNKVTPSCRSADESKSWQVESASENFVKKSREKTREGASCKKFPTVIRVGVYLRKCKEVALEAAQSLTADRRGRQHKPPKERSHSVSRLAESLGMTRRKMPRSRSADFSTNGVRLGQTDQFGTRKNGFSEAGKYPNPTTPCGRREKKFSNSFQTIFEKNELSFSYSGGSFVCGCSLSKSTQTVDGMQSEDEEMFECVKENLMKWDLTNIVEVLFQPLYDNFCGSRSVLMRQARDLLLCTYAGNVSQFNEEFCIPAGKLIRRLKHHVKKFGRGIAAKSWPLSYGDGGIILHLGEIDESLLRNRDCYVCLREDHMKKEGEEKRDTIEVALIWRNGKKIGTKTIVREDEAVGDEIVSPMTMSEAVKADDDLTDLLQNLLVSVEHAIQRVPIENLAFPCPKCHEYFELEVGSEESGTERCGCECSMMRPKPIEKKDSSIQTSPMFEIVGSIPHIDSDEEGDGREEEEEERCLIVKAEETNSGPVSTGTMTRKSRELVPPKSLEEIPQRVLMSGIHLLGSKDVDGRPLIVLDGSTIVRDKLTRYETAKVLLYYVTIPEQSELNKGVTMLLLLPCDRENEEIELFEMLDQAFHLAKKLLKVHVVLGCSVQNGSLKPAIETVPRFLPFPKTKIKYHFITDEASLRIFVSPSDTPQSCGGKITHDQLEWIEFFKEFEPFVNLCHVSGRRLVDLMIEFRSSEDTQAQLSRRQIHHQQRVIARALNEADLQRLRKEGNGTLARLEERAQWLQSLHVRSNLQQAKRLFAEVDRAAKRLEQLLEKRRQRLKELIRLRALEDESSQVLSWLMKRGEDTLKKHSELATSLQGIKNQEQDFEKFYFISMRHLDKGNDLVDEIGQTSGNEEMATGSGNASNLRDLAKSLKMHLRGFGEKLEDTRERLEDTSRCFYLLDRTYEWSLDTSKYMNRIKTDEEVSEEMARQMLTNIEQRLSSHSPLSEAHFAEMSNLAKKLDNEKLMEQCRLAQSRYQEALEVVQNTQSRLLQIVNSNAEESPLSPFMVNWNMIMSRLPGGTFNIGRRRSLASFPYIYKCSHHAAGHDCSCDPSVTRDPSKPMQKMNASQCQCACGTLVKPLTDIRENPEDLPHQKINDWEYNGPRSAMKRHLRRTSTWQYPAEGFDDQDNNSNKSSHSGESDNKDLDEHDVSLSSPSVPVSVSVNSHLYCHASNLSLNVHAQGEQVRDAKTQKTLLLIMREMIQTERDYVASLEYVIENYIPQLLREDIPQALRGQRNVVFGNVEKIYEFHSQHFLQELESCEKSPLSVGQCFLKYEKKFYLYALYNKNKPKSDSLMAEYGSNFFKMKQIELGDKMDLASYLLKPVQRMGKYALLLQQLMKASGERESSDLSSAEAMVRFQLRHGNDLLAMDSLRDCDVNLKEQGRLLRQNEFLVWQGKGKKCLRHVFLFEELILFSKARRFPDRKNLDIYIYKNSIKTTDIGLTAKIGDSPTKFEIWFRKRKPNDTFTLQSMSEEVKQAWTEELSGILWKQALKNREMRLQEMSSMGIGNKPCLDIRPSADQINDRSISVAQLNKTAPRFRNSIAVLSRDALGSNKRPHSIISVTSSSSSGGSSGSGSHVADSPRLPRSALHSQCSAESGIITDMSLTSEEHEGRDRRWHLERSNSTVTSASLDSSLSPVLSSDDISGFVTSLYDNDAGGES